MSTFMVEIQPNPNCPPDQPAQFSPQALGVRDGDTIAWHNGDAQAHWPAPSASNQTGWFPTQLAPDEISGGFAVGPNPAAYSTNSSTGAVTVNSTILAQPYNLNYVCAIHPDETGSITVYPVQ